MRVASRIFARPNHCRISLALVLSAALACTAKKEDKSDESEETTGGAGEIALGDNALAESYPQELAVTTFSSETTPSGSAETSGSGTIAVAYELALALQDGDQPLGDQPLGDQLPPLGDQQDQACGDTPQEFYEARNEQIPDGQNTSIFADPAENKDAGAKRDAALQRLKGDGECYSEDLAVQMKIMAESIRHPNLDGSGCYRPDWGILSGKFGDTDEVCMVGFARNELGKLGSYVDFSQLLLQAMLCQAKKDGLADALPAENTSLDLTASLKAGVLGGGDRITATSATLYRSADVDGKRSYRTDIELAAKAPDSAGSDLALTIAIHLIHSPASETDKTVDGVLWIDHDLPKDGLSPSAPAKHRALSLSYESTPDDVGTRVKYEMRAGNFASTLDVFSDGGVLDFNTGAKFTGDENAPTYGAYSDAAGAQQNDYAAAMNYVTWDGYPDLNVGKLSYWVSFGGNYEEPSRGFVFDVQRVDGVTKGCGIAGAVVAMDANNVPDSTSIRRALHEETALYPNGYHKPFSCTDKGGKRVWQQCFVQNDAGAYVIDDAKTTDTAKGFDFVAVGDVNEGLSAPPKPPRGFQLPPPPPPADQPPPP
jgi:hypothetical protein